TSRCPSGNLAREQFDATSASAAYWATIGGAPHSTADRVFGQDAVGRAPGRRSPRRSPRRVFDRLHGPRTHGLARGLGGELLLLLSERVDALASGPGGLLHHRELRKAVEHED